MLRALTIVVCVLALLPSGGAARAHALLLDTQPSDGASLAVAPPEIVLRFNEPVAPVALRLLDASGADLVKAAARAENNEIRLVVPPLPAGGYLASWRVVSADSHPIGGGFVFTVGTAAAPEALPSTDARREEVWTVAVMLNRAVLYAALMFAAGGTLFTFFVLRPLGIGIASFARWRVRAALVALAAAILGIGLKGGQLGALPAAGLLEAAAWLLGLASSAARSAAIVAVGLLTLIVAQRAGRARAWIELAGAVVALAGLSATGHAAASSRGVQALAIVHALCAGFWLGAFWPLLRLVPAHPAASLAAARRFSDLALPAVLVLAATGAGMALSRVTAPGELTGSPYGLLLLFKLLSVVTLLIVAGANRWQTVPDFAAGRRRGAAQFARNVRLEIGLGATILILTAVLTHTPPPGMAPDHDHGTAGGTGHAVWLTQRNRALLLDVMPATAGANAIAARFSTDAGEALAPLEATVSFARPDAGIEAIARPLTKGADGVFRLERIVLPLAGSWRVRVDALIDDFDKAIFETEIPISAAVPPR